MELEAVDLIRCTIRILGIMRNGSHVAGTGFFFSFGNDDEVMIVTSKHVVEHAVECILHFSIEGDDEVFVNERIPANNDSKGPWIPHPNPLIDLSVLPIGDILRRLENEGKRIAYTVLKPEMFLGEGAYRFVSPIEDLIYVGYPEKIGDEANDQPVIRQGITATKLKSDFEKNPFFYIDAMVYGGSTGSPVFLYRHGLFHNDEGHLVHGTEYRPVGILQASVDFMIEGNIDFTDARGETARIIPISKMPNNFGRVIKINHLLAFKELL